VDCQTWVMSVLGKNQVESWFGAGAADRIWLQTKKLGGFKYTAGNERVVGLGYSFNSQSQAYSGEWTSGAINMLRIFAKESGERRYMDEADEMKMHIEHPLAGNFTLGGRRVEAVKYANERYYIPFGWWANPFPNIASTAWLLFLDSNFNPFNLGGAYLPPK